MHIGEKIAEVLKAKHMTKQELGRTLGMSGSAATYLTTRPTIDVETLQKIGTVVSYNFFRHYPVEEPGAGDNGQGDKSEKDTLINELRQKMMEKDRTILALRREVELRKQENEYLKKINELLELKK
jgi:transcriptional regulator with XRE-family HTH domain